MKLVIDASVGVKTLFAGYNTQKALQLRDDFRKGIHELFAPDLYFLEVGNVLINAARAGHIKQADLPVLYADLLYHQPIIVPAPSLFPRAFSIASQIRVSIYDATYLALSEQEGCPLLTDDVKLIRAAPGFSTVTLDQL